MKKILYNFIFLFIFSVSLFAQVNPVQFFLQSEENPQMLKTAQSEIAALDQPKSIYLPEQIFIDLKGLIDGKPAYAVMCDILNPYNGLQIMSYEQVLSTFDLTNARITYADGRTINESLGFPQPLNKVAATCLFFMESTGNRVITLDLQTGDVINASYLTDAALQTPKQARLSPYAFISISDQILDVVNKYDTIGTFLSVFAPAGGVNNTILDNIRGHNYKDGFLFVANAGSTTYNPNCVAKFDSIGNYLGNFIANAAGSINSPYDILFRTNDVLVDGSSSHKIHKYDLTGASLGDFRSYVAFPQQMYEAPNGDIIVADFGVGGGLRVYSASGDSISLFNVITANRGAVKLGNGNYLTSNAAGLHEISSTGALVRTIVAGVSGQYITPNDYELVPVELTSFNASVNGKNIELKWSTATEMNNSGFEIERSTNNISYKKIGFIRGAGNSSEINSYNFIDKNPSAGKYYYRLKQIDYNNTFEYSEVKTVEISLPSEFIVEQNFPNPFNPVTNIKFSIPADTWVKVEIFNAVGQKAAEIQNGMMTAGSHEISFNASNLNSGIYYYKVSAGNSSVIKKMILMK